MSNSLFIVCTGSYVGIYAYSFRSYKNKNKKENAVRGLRPYLLIHVNLPKAELQFHKSVFAMFYVVFLTRAAGNCELFVPQSLRLLTKPGMMLFCWYR